NDDKPRLLTIVREMTTAERFGQGDGACGASIEPGVAGRTAFTLRVQTGCAEPCSYCIIPATRGMPRSVPIADVLREISRAAAAGFKEITITGVNRCCDRRPFRSTYLLTGPLRSAITNIPQVKRQLASPPCAEL